MKNTIITEEQLLNSLDIPDWRHMSKDKIMTFATSLPYLDPEIAKAALQQFPNFKDLSNEIVISMKNSLNEITEKGDKSNNRVYQVNTQILNALENRLQKPFLLPGERAKIIDAMLEVSKNINEADKTHKQFLLHGLRQVAGVAAVALSVAGTAIGLIVKRD